MLVCCTAHLTPAEDETWTSTLLVSSFSEVSVCGQLFVKVVRGMSQVFETFERMLCFTFEIQSWLQAARLVVTNLGLP